MYRKWLMGLTILLTSFTAWVPEAKSLLLLLWFSGFHCLCSFCCVHTWKWGRKVPRQDFYSFKVSRVPRPERAMDCNAKGSALHKHLFSAPCHPLLAKARRELGIQPKVFSFFFTELFSNRIVSLSCFSVRMHKYLPWHKIDGHFRTWLGVWRV